MMAIEKLNRRLASNNPKLREIINSKQNIHKNENATNIERQGFELDKIVNVIKEIVEDKIEINIPGEESITNKKSSSNTKLIIGGVVVAVIVAAGIYYYFSSGSSNKDVKI